MNDIRPEKRTRSMTGVEHLREELTLRILPNAERMAYCNDQRAFYLTLEVDYILNKTDHLIKKTLPKS